MSRFDGPATPRREPRHPDDLLTVEQAAEQYGVSQKTIRRHIDKGAIKVIQFGENGAIRIKRSVLDEYVGW
jgi:excisionase family DNA binding protein